MKALNMPVIIVTIRQQYKVILSHTLRPDIEIQSEYEY